MSKSIVRTIYGDGLQHAKYLGLPYQPQPKTTLNERFEVNAGVQLPLGKYPYTVYYAIGDGGHSFELGNNQRPRIKYLEHYPEDAACYTPVPFVLRPIGNDLSAAQRAMYGIRRVETYMGVQYYAYYLKRLDTSKVDQQYWRITVKDGQEVPTPFVPDTANLNPVPRDLPPTGVVTSDGSYLTVSSIVTLDFNEFDAMELRNVAKVIYDDEELAIVSEIAFVSGADRDVTVPSGAQGNVNFKEVICAQVNCFVSTFHDVYNNNLGFIYDYDLGSAEPLLTGNGKRQLIARPAPTK